MTKMMTISKNTTTFRSKKRSIRIAPDEPLHPQPAFRAASPQDTVTKRNEAQDRHRVVGSGCAGPGVE
jgi:hypothetical protein